MLTVHKIKNIEYYISIAAEDYYTKGGEPPGLWLGSARHHLGLRGNVDDEIYRNLMAGKLPDGTELCQLQGDHVPAWDLTFSSPKSVSILWARADQQLKKQVQQAHLDAVQRALNFIEQHASFTRRGKGGAESEAVAGLLAAGFEHGTSRELDPQLHTHCVVFNIAPREDGTWGTLDSKHFYKWKMASGAMYRAQLAKNLQEFGFGVEQDEAAFHVTGIDKTICDHYSKRAASIEKELAKIGVDSSASAAGKKVKLSTRSTKSEIDRPSLFEQWHAELDELGFTTEKLHSIRKQNVTALAWLEPAEILESITQKSSVFREQDVYQATAEHAQWNGTDAKTAEKMAAKILAHVDTIALGIDSKGSGVYTRPEALGKEEALAKLATNMAGNKWRTLDTKTLQNCISNSDITLSDEQIAAINITASSGALTICQGSAGAGKSASMRCLSTAYHAEGFSVVGAAIAKTAAKNLTDSAGIDTHTVAKLLDSIKRGENILNDKTVLIVDEAGQIGTYQLAALLEAADSAGSKVILVGEDKQLDAIEHGGWLRFLSKNSAIPVARMQTIVRQNESWARQAVAQLRDGNASAALKTHAELGLLNIEADKNATHKKLLSQWKAYQQQHPNKKSLILAQRWSEIQEISQQVRAYHQERGAVKSENIKISCVVGEKEFVQEFSTGERIRFCKNDYKRNFTNGTLGTIIHIEQYPEDISLTIKLDDGRVVNFNKSDYSDKKGHMHIVQAYAMTVYSSQGVTVDGDTFVLYNTGMDRAYSYVAGSRHKYNCRWYVNSEQLNGLIETENPTPEQQRAALAENMSKDHYNILALEYWQKLTLDDREKYLIKSSSQQEFQYTKSENSARKIINAEI